MALGAVLRRKWNYLRDQFNVEYSKINTPRSGDAAETATEPKWPYFKQMLFLKDIATPRASSSNLKPKAPTMTEKRESHVSQFANYGHTAIILPFVSKIPTEKKLNFRSRIQQVVEEFAFPKCILQQPTYARQSTHVSNSLLSPTQSTTSHDSTSYDSRLSAVDHYLLVLG